MTDKFNLLLNVIMGISIVVVWAYIILKLRNDLQRVRHSLMNIDVQLNGVLHDGKRQSETMSQVFIKLQNVRDDIALYGERIIEALPGEGETLLKPSQEKLSGIPDSVASLFRSDEQTSSPTADLYPVNKRINALMRLIYDAGDGIEPRLKKLEDQFKGDTIDTLIEKTKEWARIYEVEILNERNQHQRFENAIAALEKSMEELARKLFDEEGMQITIGLHTMQIRKLSDLHNNHANDLTKQINHLRELMQTASRELVRLERRIDDGLSLFARQLQQLQNPNAVE